MDGVIGIGLRVECYVKVLKWTIPKIRLLLPFLSFALLVNLFYMGRQGGLFGRLFASKITNEIPQKLKIKHLKNYK